MGILSGLFSGPQGLDVEKRFEAQSPLVSGSMATYQKVRDRETKKLYGIKILDSEKTSQFRDKFKGLELPTEAEIASKFDHANIIKVKESGKTSKGEDYLLLEHCTGVRLDDAIRRAKEQSLRPKTFLLQDMIRSLIAVHRVGFVHRDICPRNFFLDDQSGKVKLFDFGISLPNKREFLQAGSRPGSALYQAPEIVRRKDYDQRADIFALGVSMFKLLALVHPWDGASAVSFDTTQPQSLKVLCPDLDSRIADAIHRCIEPNPEKRFSNLNQLQFTISKATK